MGPAPDSSGHAMGRWLRLSRESSELHPHRAGLPTLRPLGAESGEATDPGLPAGWGVLT